MAEERKSFDVGNWKYIPGGMLDLGRESGEKIYVPPHYFQAFGGPKGVKVIIEPNGEKQMISAFATTKARKEANKALRNQRERTAMLINFNRSN